MIACAFATSAETSATTAFFSSRLRLKVYLQFQLPLAMTACGTNGDLEFRKIPSSRARHLRRIFFVESRFDTRKKSSSGMLLRQSTLCN
jgi:hypothetical protein